jgi:thiopurine S-methyltransferase
MAWLRGQGHSVLGVELSPLAAGDFFAGQGIAASVRRQGAFDVYEGEGVQILCGDFFALTGEDLAGVRAVYDRAALVALPGDLQARYARHLLDILPQRPPILLISFEYEQAEMDGPPFSTPGPAVEAVFGEAYRIELVSAQDVLDANPGLRARGVSRLAEKTYRLLKAV